MYCVISFEGTLFYTLYEKAFKVPVLSRRSSSLLRLLGSRLRNKDQRKLLEKTAAMSIFKRWPSKYGTFILERISTPLFVDIVLGNAVSMLVAYG